MLFKLSPALLIGLFVTSCAQVPKESVELSATVGRDLATVHNAHRETAQILFASMRRDINRFVDEVYAPSQIRNAMDRQKQLATSAEREEQKKSLLLAINRAFEPGASSQLQEAVLRGMDAMVRQIREDVEAMRKELLDPLEAQQLEIMGSIDRAYQQLHYANSIVTGHLSSVAKVHDTQADLLRTIGVERDLRAGLSEKLAKTSQKIGTLVKAAEAAEDRLKDAEENAQKLKSVVKELEAKLR